MGRGTSGEDWDVGGVREVGAGDARSAARRGGSRAASSAGLARTGGSSVTGSIVTIVVSVSSDEDVALFSSFSGGAESGGKRVGGDDELSDSDDGSSLVPLSNVLMRSDTADWSEVIGPCSTMLLRDASSRLTGKRKCHHDREEDTKT